MLGRWGEDLAIKWLTNQGLQVVKERFRTPYGEIDIIMRDHEQFVFVEVKTRRNDHLGYPESAINTQKFQHLTNSADYFFQQNPGLDDNWRIDILAIIGSPQKISPDIQWFKNVHP